MPAYVVGHIRIRNPEKWAQYRTQVPATLHAWNAELMLRGQKHASLSGELPFDDIVVIRFADTADASGWFASAAYQALIPLRQEAADVVLLSYAA